MRTTKRFDPSVLDRFKRQGRGQGTHQAYQPWHQVTRGDPASCGRSHLMHWRGRLHHLLSDLEWGAQLFGLMPAELEDSIEQVPLALDSAKHPLLAYTVRAPLDEAPGTLELARDLGIPHPRVNGQGRSADWHPSTDLVLVFRNTADSSLRMLAIAVKPSSWETHPRTVELLRLERAYWLARNVEWLLITPQVWTKSVVLTLRRTCPWALAEGVPAELPEIAAQVARENPWSTVTALIEGIEKYAESRHQAQCALWQSIWTGALPICLERGWRPHEPLQHVSEQEFWTQNPIVSRRSAWT